MSQKEVEIVNGYGKVAGVVPLRVTLRNFPSRSSDQYTCQVVSIDPIGVNRTRQVFVYWVGV